MTNEEAYKILMSDADFDFGKASEKNKQTADALCVAVKALKKQIPKKPKYVEVERDSMDMETGEEYTYKIDEAYCCNCNSLIGNEYDRFDEDYCNECGQKIDWSEEGEQE